MPNPSINANAAAGYGKHECQLTEIRNDRLKSQQNRSHLRVSSNFEFQHNMPKMIFQVELPMNVRVVSNVLALLLFLVAASATAGDDVGTYSTLAFNAESGDLHGLEIAIIPVDGGLAVSVQLAEDGINELHLAKIEKSDGVMQFSIRLDDGSIVSFLMSCTLKMCDGKYIWGKADVKFKLPKNVGYWNKTRSVNAK